jgi:Putative transposase
LHCVVPGGGLSVDGQRWIPCRRSQKNGNPFFLSVKVLSARFRHLFRDALLDVFQQGQLSFFGDLAGLSNPSAFRHWLQAASHRPWVVYAKRPLGGPAQVIDYLGRYTHRVAISNHRLLKIDDGRVSFRWKDYRHGGVQKTLSLDAVEFLRRFCLHVLPAGFVRIRHFGWLANCRAQDQLTRCRQLLQVDPASLLLPTAPADWKTLSHQLTGKLVDLCPLCQKGRLLRVQPLHCLVPQLSRSPPPPSATAFTSSF